MRLRVFAACVATFVVGASDREHAQAAPPAERDDSAFDIMNLLSQRGLHNIHNEQWNLYGHFTYISNWKRPFSAPYTNANGSIHSLLPHAERSFTGNFTLF